jgi:hypothetical protein
MDGKFKYLLDPLFLFSLTLYSLNKLPFLSHKFWNSELCDCYLNDLLTVPVLVPIILFFSKIFKFRDNYSPPTLLEIIVPLTIWSVAFELIGPFYFAKGISDPIDVLAYFLGGLASWIFWNRSNLLDTLRTLNGRPL